LAIVVQQSLLKITNKTVIKESEKMNGAEKREYIGIAMETIVSLILFGYSFFIVAFLG